MKHLIRIILVVFTAVILIGCKTKYIEVPIEKIVTEKEFIERLKRDSIHVYDSIFMREKGDTVFLNKYRYIYKDRLRIDTVRYDSIVYKEKAIYVDKLVPYVPKWVKIFATFGILSLMFFSYNIYKKVRQKFFI